MAIFILSRAFFISSLLVGALPVAYSAPVPVADASLFNRLYPQSLVKEVAVHDATPISGRVIAPASFAPTAEFVNEDADSSDAIELQFSSEDDETASGLETRQCRQFCMWEVPDTDDSDSTTPESTTEPVVSEPAVSSPVAEEPTETALPAADELATVASELLTFASAVESDSTVEIEAPAVAEPDASIDIEFESK